MTMTARQILDKSMTEAEFQALIIDTARAYGYHLIFHDYDSTKNTAGFPDLVIAGHGRTIFAELKTEKGRVSMAQSTWLSYLANTQTEAYLWRPSQYETITAILRDPVSHQAVTS